MLFTLSQRFRHFVMSIDNNFGKGKKMCEIRLDVIIFVFNRKNVTILMSSKPPSRFSFTFIFIDI